MVFKKYHSEYYVIKR